MKTIGLVGGMSWESSIEYYRIINEEVRTRLGGLHSARLVMFSVDFAEIEPLQHEGKWDEAARKLVAAAGSVESAGADFVLLCTNTMHKVADRLEAAVEIPLLHIADPTARKIQARGLSKVGLLGTRFTMEEDFYKGRLVEKHGLDVLVPDDEHREIIHRIIYDELCLGQVRPSSRDRYLDIIDRLVDRGAEGIILGCTEIGLLIREGDTAVPLFDTTTIHAAAAVELALGQ
jgi:aspartate racemase